MGFWGRLTRPRAESGNWFTAFKDALEANRSHAGIAVTQDSAMRLMAVFRCITLNSETVSSLPVKCLRDEDGKRVIQPLPGWMKQPNADCSFPELIQQAQASLDMDGNAFFLKASTPGGQLAGLYCLNPQAVRVDRLTDTGGRVYFVKKTAGAEEPFASTAIVHIRGFTLPGAIRGLSPLEYAKQSIGLGLAAEQYGAQFFGTGATLSGIIKIAQKMDPAMEERLREQFKRKHGGISKSHAIGILTGGAEWVPLSVNPNDSQFLETRRFTAVEIACMYGVPAEYVTEVEGAKGYVSGLYARQYMWLQTGINPRLVRLERAFSELMRPGDYMKFNRNAFLAMDPTERKSFYGAGLQGQWLVPNEIREKEDMDPLPGGDEKLWSVQWRPPSTEQPAGNEPAQAGFSISEGGANEA